MERPGASLIGSVVVHVAVVGVAVLGLMSWGERETVPIINAVPVTIVSEMVIEAAAADNPSEELVAEDMSTAPVAAPPEPTPPEPTPTPPAPRPVPAKAPTPRPLPTPPPPKARPTPPRPTPARPAAPRPEPTLDLDSLAGPARPATRPGTRPATGQQGRGAAPRAVGRASLQALAAQVTPHWNINCDLPGSSDLTIGVRVTLNKRGGIVGSPRLSQSRGDPVWRAAADGVLRAIRAAAPFEMPADYEEQEIPFSFRTATMCANR